MPNAWADAWQQHHRARNLWQLHHQQCEQNTPSSIWWMSEGWPSDYSSFHFLS